MDKPPTREQLLRWAESSEVEANELLEYARRLRITAETAPSETGLRIDRTERTIPNMNVNVSSHDSRVKLGAGRATRKHQGQKKLYEKGVTITELANKLGEKRARVSAWFAEGEARRPVPAHIMKKLKDDYGLNPSWFRVAD